MWNVEIGTLRFLKSMLMEFVHACIFGSDENIAEVPYQHQTVKNNIIYGINKLVLLCTTIHIQTQMYLKCIEYLISK